jgi:hypothetical protein
MGEDVIAFTVTSSYHDDFNKHNDGPSYMNI